MRPRQRDDLRVDMLAGETRCTARSKRSGERCKRPSSLGANVCRSHGSEAPQTKAKANARLAQAADALVQRLLQFALDGDVADAVALQAIRDALTRAGVGERAAVEVSAPVFQHVFEGILRRGAVEREPVSPATFFTPPAELSEYVDAEFVVDPPRPANYPVSAEQPKRHDILTEEEAMRIIGDQMRAAEASRKADRKAARRWSRGR